mmetsp:Transcript_8848/g.14364  ORF Transcript_8848/g.14364 Transcript_8848/m.14364 type:complete len:98 (+) Transcript_8848:45-338(+)
MELEIRELENACRHLERSNVELLACLTDQDDADFRLAIEENVEALAVKRKKIQELQEILDKARGAHGVDEKLDTQPVVNGGLQASDANPEREQGIVL